MFIEEEKQEPKKNINDFLDILNKFKDNDKLFDKIRKNININFNDLNKEFSKANQGFINQKFPLRYK